MTSILTPPPLSPSVSFWKCTKLNITYNKRKIGPKTWELTWKWVTGRPAMNSDIFKYSRVSNSNCRAGTTSHFLAIGRPAWKQNRVPDAKIGNPALQLGKEKVSVRPSFFCWYRRLTSNPGNDDRFGILASHSSASSSINKIAIVQEMIVLRSFTFQKILQKFNIWQFLWRVFKTFESWIFLTYCKLEVTVLVTVAYWFRCALY